MNPIVQLNKVSFSPPGLSNENILENTDFQIDEGEHCLLLGDVGSGKSPTLMLLAGIWKAQKGEVSLFGHLIDKFKSDKMLGTRTRIGMVFQGNGRLLPNLNLRNNIELPLRYHGFMDFAHAKQLRKWIDLFELGPYLEKAPAEVKMHFCRRAAMARALSMDPDLLLLDELLTGLHAQEKSWWLYQFEHEIATARLGHRPTRSIILACSEANDWKSTNLKKVRIQDRDIHVL